MKKLTWTWKKIVTLICGALGIGTLVSCYGVVNINEDIYSLSGTIVDEEGKTIPGIRVSAILLTRGEYDEPDDLDYPDDFDYNGSTKSDDDGTYYLSWEAYGEYTAHIYAEDVDGDENGSFKNQLFDVDYSNVEGVGSKPGFIHYDIKDKKIQLTKKTDNEDTNE